MLDHRKILIRPDATLLEAMKVNTASGLQLALVADEDGRLLGTITDGDIRRAILKGRPLEDSVAASMNTAPVFGRVGESPNVLRDRLNTKTLRVIPLLNKDGSIAGVETIENLLTPPVIDNRVVIMAGGLGTRLHPLTENCPKPLLKVGDKPILETILDNFMAYGFRNFTLSVNYKSDMVMDHFGDGSQLGCSIEYLCEDKRMGTAGALSLFNERPDKPFFVMNGDLLTTINFKHFLDFHERTGAEATMGVCEHAYQIPYGVVRVDENRIVDLEEKPTNTYYINAGVYMLSPSALDAIPENEFFDMPQLFRRLMDAGRETTAYPVRGLWIDIGQHEDLERAHVTIQSINSCNRQ
ncbi:nucleotidyltransferase family protein [Salidesulfovibrio brasiliensis]|uniref:nucleotidyltransferase family protein n=1 Tax=Salidesulfovibrio brasiliensis TaxID=221711 RepID=UPI0006D07E04|nr:nucleotidyltransferase family protein [Salidesulfovibrio brasiliensis]